MSTMSTHPSPLRPLLRLFPVFAACAALAPLASAQDQSFKPGQGQPRSPTPSKQAPAKDRLKEEGHQVFGTGKARAPEAAAAPAWSILIVAYRGETQDADAARALQNVQREGGLREAYTEKRGGSTVVAYGRYDDPSGRQAKADLERVKNIEVVMDGQKLKPFVQAFLAPPAEAAGTIPEYDLHQARKTSGDWVLYTLQVGVYGRGDGKPVSSADLLEFRKAAEQAVVQLRREGEQAFYAHGPKMSMVTIGLFGKDDFDPQAGTESPALRMLRTRYPYNLLNGMGIKQKLVMTNPKTGAAVKKEKLEASVLVNVPKE